MLKEVLKVIVTSIRYRTVDIEDGKVINDISMIDFHPSIENVETYIAYLKDIKEAMEKTTSTSSG